MEEESDELTGEEETDAGKGGWECCYTWCYVQTELTNWNKDRRLVGYSIRQRLFVQTRAQQLLRWATVWPQQS